MRNIINFSAYEIWDSEKPGFSADDYSIFKHGSERVARNFGYALADKFISQHPDLFDGREIVVIPSAYSYIRTASCFLTSFFIDRLNFFLFTKQLLPVEQAKIYRTVTYREDYGEMTAEQRFNLIKGDKFHIDKSFLKDKTLLFIDDIKITGTHERIILKMLDDFQVSNDCYMLYFAELKNSEINPRFENFLNQHYVRSLEQVNSIIRKDDFVFNTRVVKFILGAKEGDFDSFIKQQSVPFIRELLSLSIGNSYYQFQEYQLNIQSLISLLDKFEKREDVALSFASVMND